jgi:hypothetical protein
MFRCPFFDGLSAADWLFAEKNASELLAFCRLILDKVEIVRLRLF